MSQEPVVLPGGTVINGYAVGQCEGPRPAFMLLPGRGSTGEKYFPTLIALASLGYTGMILNLRGHGKAEGNLSELTAENHLDDALEGYDWLASRPQVDHQRIGIIGISYGGYLGVALLERRPLYRLCLRAPAIYRPEDVSVPFNAVVTDELREWRRCAVPWSELPILTVAHEKSGQCRVLIVESGKDESIPHSAIMNYQEAFAGAAREYRHILMPEAGHGLKSQEEIKEFKDILEMWLNEETKTFTRSE